MTPADLAQVIETRAAPLDRCLIGIAGAPGSGKSTLAADLAARLGDGAAVLPMDGFHLDNDTLKRMDILDRKGAPETFDAAAFVQLMHDLRSQPCVSYPTFDRAADKTIPSAGQIDHKTRIVLVEGNYLLLDIAPWSDLAGIFDMTVRLDTPREVLQERLVRRWRDHGLSEIDAHRRAIGNDMKNVDLVIKNSRSPGFLLSDWA